MEVFCDRSCCVGGADVERWCVVGGSCDDDRFLEFFGAQVMADEFVDFVVSFVDQVDYCDVGLGVLVHYR